MTTFTPESTLQTTAEAMFALGERGLQALGGLSKAAVSSVIASANSVSGLTGFEVNRVTVNYPHALEDHDL